MIDVSFEVAQERVSKGLCPVCNLSLDYKSIHEVCKTALELQVSSTRLIVEGLRQQAFDLTAQADRAAYLARRVTGIPLEE